MKRQAYLIITEYNGKIRLSVEYDGRKTGAVQARLPLTSAEETLSLDALQAIYAANRLNAQIAVLKAKAKGR